MAQDMIDNVTAEDVYIFPTSFSQQRLWFLNELTLGDSAYNLPTAIRFKGNLDVAALEKSINEIIRRHEVLRTTFSVIDGELMQVVKPAIPLTLKVKSLNHLPRQEREAQTRRAAKAEARQPFNLGCGPLLRVTLLELEPDEHVLLFTIHHIIADGWSMGVIVREVTTLYDAFSSRRPSPLEELPIQYADYALWQRGWLQGEVFNEQLAYWRGQLAGAPPVLELPLDKPRPGVQTFRGTSRRIELSHSLIDSLKKLSQRNGVTLFTTMLAAFQTLLFRYTSQKDVVVGAPIAGRRQLETEGLIGFFINTLTLRTRIRPDESFRALLARVQEMVLDAYAHQDLPFEKLVEYLQPERNLSHSPLFQVMIMMQNAPRETLEMKGMSVSGLGPPEDISAKFDLTMTITERGENLSVALGYNVDLFEVATIERMLGNFERLLQEIARNCDEEVSLLRMLTDAERYQLLTEWNAAATDYPTGQCLHQLFEAQAALTPDRLAIVDQDRSLTYEQLNARANRLAHCLQSMGVGPEVIVGILMERSIETIVAMLGTLKAGGAYLPLDPAYPQERIAFMLQDARTPVLLAQRSLAGRINDSSASMLFLDAEWETIAQYSDANLQTARADHLAYVIYTSGSTGLPKGVAIEHRSPVVLTYWARELFEREDLSRVLAATSICFDLSIFEIFVPLGCGGTVILARDALHLTSLPARDTITLVNTVPSAMAELTRVNAIPDSVRTVNLAGEALKNSLAQDIYRNAKVERVFNFYGPSEDTTYSTGTLVLKGATQTPTIGRPISQTQTYVLDSRMEVAPIGVIGELYIGGDGLARNYLDRPALTAERFVPDPFANRTGGRLYRTGDLVRYRPDGEIEFLGRGDHQVKIRGYRVELGEIEAALMNQGLAQEAVVVAREEKDGDKRLVAYVVGAKAESGELRRLLRERLPEYMTPAWFVKLEEMPLTPNGKVDRNALPTPKRTGGNRRERLAPRTPVEQALHNIWSEVLRSDQVGVDDNFFESGGHSLLATQVVSRIRETLRVEISLKTLFESPTVAGLAESINRMPRGQAGSLPPPIAPIMRNGELPLSFAQQRLWFLDQLNPGNSHYNCPLAVRMSGQLNVGALERTLREVVRRHEALRTKFPSVDGQPRQQIDSDIDIRLPVVDLSGLKLERIERETERLAKEEIDRAFDLSRGPMLRTTLLRLAENEHAALMTMHHIVSDAWSMGVLTREVAALYEAYSQGRPSPLPELPIQYVDYAVWQRNWLRGEVLEKQVAYWRKQLDGVQTLDLPADRSRSTMQRRQGAHWTFMLEETLTSDLKALSQRAGVTLFTTLLAAFQALSHRYTSQGDIAVGSPIAGRGRLETEGLIGFFVNTLVLRTKVSGDESFRTILERAHDVMLGAQAHQDIPFEKLVEELRPERSLSRTPFFQVMMVMQNTPRESHEITGMKMRSLGGEEASAKFDLTLIVIERERKLLVSFRYDRDLFDQWRIEQMGRHYLRILESVVNDPEQQIGRINLLEEEERKRIIEVWNRTKREIPSVSLPELFEAQVRSRPESVAVIYQEQTLSYGELNRRANRLARYLKRLGVGPEALVGICVERSPEIIVGLLGILKAGGAYQPLDPAYPIERLRYMLEDGEPRVLLTQERLLGALPEFEGETVCLDRDWPLIAEQSEENPVVEARSKNLAYVIYTSGSTGRPKGVGVTQRNVARLVRDTNYAELDERQVILQYAPLAFDASTFEIWGALLNGGRLVVMGAGQASLAELGEVIERHGVRTMWLTASLLNAMVDVDGALEMLRGVEQLLAGGEALSPGHVRKALERLPRTQLINGYGPTEGATFSCSHRIGEEDLESGGSVPIGRAIANTKAYVLDGNLEPTPVGVAGELYIGGAGVARCYLKRPELTAEKFIVDPFGEPGKRMYRSGDLARWNEDGNLEFLGRRDRQVKIRGFRIELGEIEAALEEHPKVEQAVVLATEGGGGEKRLVAYVIGNEAETAELSRRVKDRLPEYMAPAWFVKLEEIPLTTNGKVDLNALANLAPLNPGSAEEFVAPRDLLEFRIAKIWEEILDVSPIGVRHNFFSLGGHSLLAVRLMAQIKSAFRRELALSTLFQNGTIEQQASILRREPLPPLTSPLVGIKTSGSRTPFFCVHPVGGNVLCYGALALHFDKDRPFYGLQAMNCDGDSVIPARLEESAARYVEAIRERQPSGPYLLGGWSLGGVLAFEIARQLSEQDQRVALLALLDSWAPLEENKPWKLAHDEAKLLTQLAKAYQITLPNGSASRRLTFDELIEQALEQAKKNKTLPDDIGPDWIHRLLRFHKQSVMEVLNYIPQSYAGQVTLFRTKRAPSRGATPDDWGWGRLSAKPVKICAAPGDHHSMLVDPHVRILARQLNACLNATGE